jgi:hypothetical protein
MQFKRFAALLQISNAKPASEQVNGTRDKMLAAAKLKLPAMNALLQKYGTKFKKYVVMLLIPYAKPAKVLTLGTQSRNNAA